MYSMTGCRVELSARRVTPDRERLVRATFMRAETHAAGKCVWKTAPYRSNLVAVV
jgi:hypothetical protein